MKVLSRAAVVVGALILAGCGSTTSHTRTRTVSEQTANREMRCAREANITLACQQLLDTEFATPNETILCGHGLSTNGGCDFASAVQAAVKAAHPTGAVTLVANTNPMRCTPSGGGFYCHSQRSQVWVRVP